MDVPPKKKSTPTAKKSKPLAFSALDTNIRDLVYCFLDSTALRALNETSCELKKETDIFVRQSLKDMIFLELWKSPSEMWDAYSKLSSKQPKPLFALLLFSISICMNKIE